ncbi:protein-methionine-sulfoxide reductase heme-binding subunit MsrQ [Maritimibacter sp. DP1N21-5]|uniref:protein-methionine-sulfoxide reductase heme-binding subunit MsrQ n=1 Tax=Maritimibacter sp. DP1N21-5 TaxID=2836867 RepID=UPI001C45075A|nr:protein-methionine-sulfoxide reductase heme-binding subunit MsrQ [Maritimibacter sp. DP1N21-5]MBV7408791.1 protein-methionine-sulfoxide reductase heme-binding subunit MsrQ [Maritimibacter sp. DP1N21-5]
MTEFARTVNGALRRVPAWPLYIIGAVPPAWLFYQGVAGNLGVDPVKEMEHQIGLLGLQVLLATLAVTPLFKLTRINLVKFRRAMGLVGFFYIVCHLAVWLFLDVQIWSQIWADIVKRPYITIGMGAFVLLIPLAVTSNDWSMRKLRKSWKTVHKLFYPAIILGGVHFFMLRKGIQLEPVLYLLGIVLLLGLRLPFLWRRRARSGQTIPREAT